MSVNVLDQIIARTRADLRTRVGEVPIADVLSAAQATTDIRPALDVSLLLKDPAQPGSLRVIAEVKRSSPSAGTLAPIEDPTALAMSYARAGADMISVLTEPHWFSGDLTDLCKVRATVDTAILRKDFIVDEYQIAEARAAGADCVLLIVAALSADRLKTLITFSRSWGMEPLVEVHNREQLDIAVDARARIIGVNARDLVTLKVLPGLFAELAPYVPAGCIAVAESGISDVAGARTVAESGADAILVGQALVQSADPAHLVRAFRAIERRQP